MIMHTNIYLSILYTHLCMYVCMHVCMYVCMYQTMHSTSFHGGVTWNSLVIATNPIIPNFYPLLLDVKFYIWLYLYIYISLISLKNIPINYLCDILFYTHHGWFHPPIFVGQVTMRRLKAIHGSPKRRHRSYDLESRCGNGGSAKEMSWEHWDHWENGKIMGVSWYF